MRWQYSQVDVTRFLATQFNVGDDIEALNPEKTFSKVTILEVPNLDDLHMKWFVRCKRTQREFSTERVRHTTDLFENLLHRFGQDDLKKLCEDAIGLKVNAVEETRLQNGAPCLAVKMDIQWIEDAHKLRDYVLSDAMKLVETLNKKLKQLGLSEELAVHKTRFFDQYARSLLRFSELTDHQKQKLQEMITFPVEDIHLTAAAGAGKTFVALRYVLHMMDTLAPSSRDKIVYVAPNRALIYHFIKWVLTHAEHLQKAVNDVNEFLSRLLVMHYPYTDFMNIRVQGSEIVLEPRSGDPEHFALAVFDEAHEILRENGKVFEALSAQRKVLLSDVSQSSMLDGQYPEMRRVTLTQIVRSTKRVMLGANAFRMEDGDPISCLGTTGPPLKSFLFDAQDDQEVFSQFAAHTTKALWHIMCTYPSIRIDQHVALIVPDMRFRNVFEPYLLKAFTKEFAQPGQVRLITFEESLRFIPTADQRSSGEDKLVFDCDENAKGLEMLFVICVGLDTKIAGDGDNATRARLYHALTRAQLQALVVDRVIRGGWLEYLTTLKLKNDHFTEPIATAEIRKDAATSVVRDAWLAVVGTRSKQAYKRHACKFMQIRLETRVHDHTWRD
eukprot:Skav211870  [mRNA]  locus=scaffold1431:208885:210723:- [translate_table: standard]